MKVIRQIVYEFEDQEDLDRQIGSSMPDGIKNIPFGGNRTNSAVKGTITVRTLHDERVKQDLFPEETAKDITGKTDPIDRVALEAKIFGRYDKEILIKNDPSCTCDECVAMRKKIQEMP